MHQCIRLYLRKGMIKDGIAIESGLGDMQIDRRYVKGIINLLALIEKKKKS